MTRKELIREFLSQSTFAVVGVSRSGRKFSNAILRDLRGKGYEVFAVNSSGGNLEGEPLYPDLSSLPRPVDGIVLVVPPAESLRVIEQVAGLGIRRVWLQQGAESREVLDLCRQKDLHCIWGECILMFAEPASFFHRLHRGVRTMLGRMPK
jgi:predicted CoA-binding protein